MAATSLAPARRVAKTGFTLLELVIVLAVMAVLLTLAVPAYRQYVVRVERTEAIRLLLAVADCQERIRAEHGNYDTTQCLDGTLNDDYEIRLEPADTRSTSRFIVLAEPNQSDGNRCGALGLDHTGTQSISAEKGDLSDCWGGR